MNLKVINNKKGSALLWAVLFTVILTILLGSVCTATYAYFNYTMYTIRRQQAYFTARSAMNAIVEEFSYQDEDGEEVYAKDQYDNVINSDGNIIINGQVYSSSYVIGKDTVKSDAVPVSGAVVNPKKIKSGNYKGTASAIPLMPASKDETIKITDFEGLDEKMGSAVATISINAENDDYLDVKVIATYADQEYDISATIGQQPIYFGGIAIKRLVLDNSNFELDEETDLYFYTERTAELLKTNANGIARTFDTTCITPHVTKDSYSGAEIIDNTYPVQLLNGSTIKINGNLVTQGDAKLNNLCTVAGRTFGTTATTFSAESGMLRKIWDKEHYIISNKTIELSEESGQYSTSISNVLQNLTNMTFEYCNNTRETMTNKRDMYILGTKVATVPATFGSRNNPVSQALNTVLSFTDSIISATSSAFTGEQTNITPFGNVLSDSSVESLAIKKTFSDATAIQYIQIMSLSNSVEYLVDYLGNSSLAKLYKSTLGAFFDTYGYTVKDISYIEFSANGGSSVADPATSPLTYLFVEDGLYVRVKYGQNPGNESTIGKIIHNAGNTIDNIASNWFDLTKNGACVVVYLGSSSTLELGTGTPHIQGSVSVYQGDKAFTAANQTYFYTIYGEPGSTVILKGEGNGGGKVPLTLIGSVECENLVVKGDVNIIYTSTNGSQVAKQQIAEYWTVMNYKD